MNKKIIIIRLVALSIVALGINGCSKSDVLAQVGNADITKPEFTRYLKHKGIDSASDKVHQRALDDYLSRTALAQAIENSEKLDFADIDTELADLKRQIVINRYFQQHLDERISDDMVRAYYANNIENYESKRARFGHILIRTNSRMEETERQARLTQAREIYSQLNTGVDFAELAQSVSEDTVSAKKGGDLGWLAEGAITPEFSSKAFALEEGEYTQPFMTSYGFHIVKQLEAPQSARKPLEAVESQIRYQLRKEAKQAEIDRLQASVEIIRNDKR